ncbi:MAG: hypothetical protein K0R09_1804 [Clostridiales bacterium]|jgi:hypothetical protein|nr:hypothetical protein [Clostridiales bacterium]
MFTKSLNDFFKNPIITVPTVLFTIVTQILLFFTFGNMAFDESLITSEFADPSIAIEYLGKFMLFGLILMLFYLLISPIVLSWTNIMCRDAVYGEKPNITDSFKQSFKFYFRMLGTLVLTFLILIGAYIVFIMLIAIPIIPLAMSQTKSSGVFAVVLIVILVFVFLIAMVFLSICIMPIQPLLIYDNLNITNSISKGFKFGFKKFFPLLGTFLLLMVIGLIITIPANIISPIASYIAAAITSYLGIFTVVFTMNLYEEYKNKSALPPVQPEFHITNGEYTPQNSNEERRNTKPNPDNNNESDNEDNPNNKFTI